MDDYEQARGLMDAGHTEDAIIAFLRSAADAPHFKTYELLGECYMRLGRFADAVLYLAAATTLNRGVRAPSLLAEAWFALRCYSEAAAAADIALGREPRNKRALEVRANSAAAMEQLRAEDDVG